jgi:hypothetical protein
MYDSSFPPPVVPPPPPAASKHSKLGIISFILAIVSILLVCLFFIFAYWLGSSSVSGGGVTVVGWVFICLISIATVTGVVLGIIALTQQAQSKVFGILGLVFNALILIGFCVFMLFAVVLAASSY